jgi:hypothetical protein
VHKQAAASGGVEVVVLTMPEICEAIEAIYTFAMALRLIPENSDWDAAVKASSQHEDHGEIANSVEAVEDGEALGGSRVGETRNPPFNSAIRRTTLCQPAYSPPAGAEWHPHKVRQVWVHEGG